MAADAEQAGDAIRADRGAEQDVLADRRERRAIGRAVAAGRLRQTALGAYEHRRRISRGGRNAGPL